MDLKTMDLNLEKDEFKEIEEFIRDFNLIISNCRLYNSENTPYSKCAKNLDTFFKQKMQEKGLLK
jgi:Bromodomain